MEGDPSESGASEAEGSKVPMADWHKVQRRFPRSRKSSESASAVELGEGAGAATGATADAERSGADKETEVEVSMDDMEELDFAFSHESPTQKSAPVSSSYNPKVSARVRNVSVVLFPWFPSFSFICALGIPSVPTFLILGE